MRSVCVFAPSRQAANWALQSVDDPPNTHTGEVARALWRTETLSDTVTNFPISYQPGREGGGVGQTGQSLLSRQRPEHPNYVQEAAFFFFFTRWMQFSELWHLQINPPQRGGMIC